MRNTRRFVTAAAAALVTTFSGASVNAASYDLGFIMDQSGSINANDYKNAMQSLATALNLALTPTIGSGDTYTVSVVRFSTSATDVITRTISTAADLTAVVTAINTAATLNTGGNTNYQDAFKELQNNFTTLGDFSLINMMTDGDPTTANYNGCASATACAIAGRDAIAGAGWDSLSFEAVGAGISDPTFLSRLAFDTNSVSLNDLQPVISSTASITNPLTDAFVLKLTNFSYYDEAIKAKVQAIVTPRVPVPGSLPLMASGLVLAGVFLRRAKRKAA
jgi:hypothetical protein